MSAELFICPNEDALSITVEEIQARFVASHLPSRIEHNEGEPWIVFDGYQSALVFTVDDGHASSAVLQAVMDDDPEFAEKVFGVFESFGWSYAEGSF